MSHKDNTLAILDSIHISIGKTSFFHFSDCGCNARGVNSTGRTCNQRTGFCNCKLNVQGSKCSSCKPFFWGLTASDGNGCQGKIPRPEQTIEQFLANIYIVLIKENVRQLSHK